MLKVVDRALSALLILGAMGHTLGVLKFYRGQPHPLFWSLGGGVLIVLVAAINLLRTDRPDDRGLAWVAAAASLIYAGIAASFGAVLVNNPFDPRAVIFCVLALGLTFFGLRTALGRR